MSYGVKITRRNSFTVDLSKLYGTLLGAIIFYNKLSKHLIDHRFVQNEYNMCTFNKMVNGKQITVQFYVDDLKVSHKEQAVLEDFLKDIRDEFGQEDELTENENKGLLHEYLGSPPLLLGVHVSSPK